MCSGAERGSRFLTFRTHPAHVPRLITFNQHKVSAVACQGCCISVLSYSCDINNLGRHCDVKQTAVCYQQIVWTVVMLRWRCSPPLSLWSSISSSAEMFVRTLLSLVSFFPIFRFSTVCCEACQVWKCRIRISWLFDHKLLFWKVVRLKLTKFTWIYASVFLNCLCYLSC